MSGAVTMKITSSTSMTSMYGTTLISFMSRRVPRFWTSTRAPPLMHLPLEDVGELLHERIEPDRKPVHVAGEAVVRAHRRDRCEETHGGGDQRFGDTGRDGRERRLRRGLE